MIRWLLGGRYVPNDAEPEPRGAEVMRRLQSRTCDMGKHAWRVSGGVEACTICGITKPRPEPRVAITAPRVTSNAFVIGDLRAINASEPSQFLLAGPFWDVEEMRDRLAEYGATTVAGHTQCECVTPSRYTALFDLRYPSGTLPAAMPAQGSQQLGEEVFHTITAVIPALSEEITCPQCTRRDDLGRIVVHLNDHHRISRQAIADWLDSLDSDLAFPTPA